MAKRPQANEANLRTAFRTDPELHEGKMVALDTFSHRILLRRPIGEVPGDWVERPIKDTDITELMAYFQALGWQKVNLPAMRRVVEWEAERNTFSSARERLESLPAWDQVARLDNFFTKVAGAEAAEEGASEDQVMARIRYLTATARVLFIGIVTRVMEPGAKFDTMVVFEGAQGTLKSTLLKVMALDRSDWFSDTMPPQLDSKGAREHLPGRLIIELSEMVHMKRSDIEAIKSFLSTQEDKYRPTWGHYEVVRPRQNVFIGSTNESGYLADITGNRRFLPVRCGTIDIELAREIMPQLYAEAIVAYRAKEKPFLPEDIAVIAESEQTKRLVHDPWEKRVQDMLNQKMLDSSYRGEQWVWISTSDVLEIVEKDMGRWNHASMMRAGAILTRIGGKHLKKQPENRWSYRFEVQGAYGKAGKAGYTNFG